MDANMYDDGHPMTDHAQHGAPDHPQQQQQRGSSETGETPSLASMAISPQPTENHAPAPSQPATTNGPAPKQHAARCKRQDLHTFNVGRTEFTIPKSYSPLEPLGKGSYGVVVSAVDKLTGKMVAVKKIPKLFSNVVFAKRCLRELKLLRHLGKHPHVVGMVDLIEPIEGEEFEDLYLVLEYMQTDLHKTIYSTNTITDEHRQYFLYQLLNSLNYIHSAGVIHRDIKPGNILLNENCRLKLCDFNLARDVPDEEDENKTTLTEYVVSRWYRAPEVVLCSAEYDSKIDIWSAGCVLAELHHRRPLFGGTDCLDQLNVILSVRGTPSEEDMRAACVGNDDALQILLGLDKKDPVPLSRIYKNATPEALDIMDKMLQFNPRKRLSALEALAHPYLKRYHSKSQTCDSRFNFEFKKGAVTKEVLQEMFLEEIDAWKLMRKTEDERRRQKEEKKKRHGHSSSTSSGGGSSGGGSGSSSGGGSGHGSSSSSSSGHASSSSSSSSGSHHRSTSSSQHHSSSGGHRSSASRSNGDGKSAPMVE